jgi:hypothetical protein
MAAPASIQSPNRADWDRCSRKQVFRLPSGTSHPGCARQVRDFNPIGPLAVGVVDDTIRSWMSSTDLQT